MLKILEELHSSNRETPVIGISSITADENRLTGYFCSNTIFNLSNRVLSDNDNQGLGERFRFCTHPKIN